MPKLPIKQNKADKKKAEKNFRQLSLTDRVRTSGEYEQICSPFPVKGKVVGKEIMPSLVIPYIVIVEIRPGKTIEINALWLEKVG